MRRVAVISACAASLSMLAVLIIASFLRAELQPHRPVLQAGLLVTAGAGLVVSGIVLMLLCGPVALLWPWRKGSRFAAILSRGASCILSSSVLQCVAHGVFGEGRSSAFGAFTEGWAVRPALSAFLLLLYAMPALIFLWLDYTAADSGPLPEV